MGDRRSRSVKTTDEDREVCEIGRLCRCVIAEKGQPIISANVDTSALIGTVALAFASCKEMGVIPEGEEVEIILEGLTVAKGTAIVQELFQQAIDVLDHGTGACSSIQQFGEAVGAGGKMRSGGQEGIQVLLSQFEGGTESLVAVDDALT